MGLLLCTVDFFRLISLLSHFCSTTVQALSSSEKYLLKNSNHCYMSEALSVTQSTNNVEAKMRTQRKRKKIEYSSSAPTLTKRSVAFTWTSKASTETHY